MTHTAEEIGAKMDALGVWALLEPYNFAVKPRGTVFPYFRCPIDLANPRIWLVICVRCEIRTLRAW